MDKHQDFYDFIHGRTPQVSKPAKKTVVANDYELPPSKPRPRPQRDLYEDEEVRRIPPKPQQPVQPPKPKMPRQLTEAYSLIEDMKVKIEDIFYRYGMIGLERLDEALEDVIDEIMNPEPVVIEKPVPQVIEKPVVKRKKRRIVRKPVQQQVDEQVDEEPVDPEEVLVDPRKGLNDLDINDLSAILGKKTSEYKTESQKKTEAVLEKLNDTLEEAKEKEEELAEQAEQESIEQEPPEDDIIEEPNEEEQE